MKVWVLRFLDKQESISFVYSVHATLEGATVNALAHYAGKGQSKDGDVIPMWKQEYGTYAWSTERIVYAVEPHEVET